MPEDHARLLRAHHRQRVLHRHHHAAQIDGHDAVERVLGDLGRRGVAARDGDPDIVVQHVDPAPFGFAVVDHGFHRGFARHVGLERRAFARIRFLGGHRAGLLGRGEIAVDAKHVRALLGEADDGRPPVAHAGSRALPGSDHDRDLVFEAHDPNLSSTAAAEMRPVLLSTVRLARLALPCHGWAGQIVPFSLCSCAHERPVRQELPAP